MVSLFHYTKRRSDSSFLYTPLIQLPDSKLSFGENSFLANKSVFSLIIFILTLISDLTLLGWQRETRVPNIQPPTLIIETEKSLEAAGTSIHAFDPKKLLSVMRLVGLNTPGKPIRVILISEKSKLARSTPPWISGLAFSSDSTVFLLPERTPSYPNNSLEKLLHHEVAHVLIQRAAGGQPLPRWFNEGLAMAAERTSNLENFTRIIFESLKRERIPMHALDGLFGKNKESSARAYTLSNAFVQDLLVEHGPNSAARILSLVASGLPFSVAFEQATSLQISLAEIGFWERNSRNHWIPFLTSSVVLWTGIVILAVVAAKKRRQKNAALRQQWEQEEAQRTMTEQDRSHSHETIH